MKLLLQRSLLLNLFVGLFFTMNLYSADYYWVGGTGNWSELSHWATSSGGSTLHTVLPGQTDDVFFDANSFSADGQTVNVDRSLVRMHDFMAQGVAFNVTISGEASFPDFEIYGSMDIPANVTLEWPAVLLDFNADVAGQTVNIANGVLNTSEDASIRFSGEGSWTLESGLSAIALFVTQGEVIFGANEFTFSNVYLQYSFDKILNLTDATFNIEKWQISSLESFVTIIPNNSTINVNDEFQGKGKTYGTVNVITPTGYVKDVEITGSNTYQDFNVAQEVNLLVESGTTQTVLGNINFNGAAATPITFEASTEGEKFFFEGAGINISGDYVNISESDFLGTATFALENSLLIGDVSGWEINSVPKPTDNGSFYYSKIYSDSLYIHLSPGNGAERIVFMREGTFAEVTVADDVAYTANQTFGAGTSVGTDTYVVYQGSDELVKIEGLNPNTTYYMAILEVNSLSDNSSIKYESTSPFYNKSASTIASGNIYMNTDAITVNGGEQFYDDGGNGFYFSNQEHVLTLNSAEAGKSVKLTFSELDLRSYEQLRIFDGADTTANLLNTLSGSSNTLPLTVSSTGEGEALTLKFYSADFDDSPFGLDGWVADVELYRVRPTQASGNVRQSAFTDSSITFSFDKGNGDGRLIVASTTNNPNNFFASDNTSYNADANYSSGEEVSTDVFAIADGDISSLEVSGLATDVDLNVRIIEYKVYGTDTLYANNSYSATVTNRNLAPSDNFDNKFIGINYYPIINKRANSIELNKIIINGLSLPEDEQMNILLLASETPIVKEALEQVLVDDFFVNANSVFGSGDEVLEGVYAISKDKFPNTLTVSDLNPETTYYFAALLLNENTNGVRYSLEKFKPVAEATTTEAEAIFLGDGNTTIDDQTILYDQYGISENNETYDYTVTYYPATSGYKLALAMSYISMPSSQDSNVIGFIVYDGKDENAPVLMDYSAFVGVGSTSDFEPLFATNSEGAITIKYFRKANIFSSSSDVNGFKGVFFLKKKGGVVPSQPASNIQVTTTGVQTANVNWVRGNGDKALVILSGADEKDFLPIDGFNYFSDSSLLKKYSRDYFSVFNGDGNQVSVSNLKAGKKYSARVFEYNVDGKGITYGKGVSTYFVMPSIKPKLNATDIVVEPVGDDGVTISWTKGDGQKRIVVVNRSNYLSFSGDYFFNKKYAALEGGVYNELPSYDDSDNRPFVLVYNGSGNSVTITGLSYFDRGYKFRVIEYNEEAGITDYKVPSSDMSFNPIPTDPTHKITDASIYGVAAASVSLEITSDNNDNEYMVVLSTDSNVTVPFEVGKIPSVIEQTGSFTNTFQGNIDGKIIRIESADSIRVDGLKPNTDYRMAVYPVNYGKHGIRYLADSYIIRSFRTTDVQEYYFVNETGYWDDLQNWKTSSGGSTAHTALPSISSIVNFDENSFDSGTDGYSKLLLRERDYSVYELNVSGIKNGISLRNGNGVTNFTIGTNLLMDEGSDFYYSASFKFLQLADTNTIAYTTTRSDTDLFFMKPGGENLSVIKRLSGGGVFHANGSKILFKLEDSVLSFSRIATKNTELINRPLFIDVAQIKSDLHFSKVISSESNLNIEKSMKIDTIYLKTSQLNIAEGDTLTTGIVERQDKLSFAINGLGGTSFIKSLNDSLIVENVSIGNNHALDSNIYIAKKSISLGNVEGWSFQADGFLIPATSASYYADKILRNSIDFRFSWYDEPRFGNRYMSIRKIGDNSSLPNNQYLPTVSNYFDSTKNVEQGIAIGNEHSHEVKGLQAGTPYELRIFDYLEIGDSIVYAEPLLFRFKTVKEEDIIMNGDGFEAIISDKRNVYGENGLGTSQPWKENKVTLVPKFSGDKLMLSLKYGGTFSNFYKLTVFDGKDSSAPILYSGEIRSGDASLENLHTGFIKATNAEGALTMRVFREVTYGSGSDPANEFIVAVSKGELAEEPTTQVSEIAVDSITQNAARITWQKGSGNKTLVVAVSGSHNNYRNLQKDGFEFIADSIFGNSEGILRDNEDYVIYNGENDNVMLTNLEPNTNYYIYAFSFNQAEGEDPNYLWSDPSSNSFYTVPKAPIKAPKDFTILDKGYNFVDFNFDSEDANAALILINEEAIPVTNMLDSLLLISKNSNSFDNLDTLADGSRFYFNNELSNYVNGFYLPGLKESQVYYYAIYNVNRNATAPAIKDEPLQGSFETNSGSYQLTNFKIDGSQVSNHEVCVGASLQIDYQYRGTTEGSKSPIAILSLFQDMSDSVQLAMESSDIQNSIIVKIPNDINEGKYYISLIPDRGKGYEVYEDTINVLSVEAPSIERIGDTLRASTSEGIKWYLNNTAFTQVADSAFLLTQAGEYFISRRFANCEYQSNTILVKPQVAFMEDSLRVCTGSELSFSYENQLGLLSDTLTYKVLLKSNINQVVEIDMDNADFENNQFTFILPADLVAGDYSLTFNTTNALIEADTAILTVERFEEPVITISDGQLSSSYAEGNQWFFNDAPIAGATAQTLETNKSGNYSLEVEVGTCLLTASVEYDILLAQKSPFEAVGLKAYPNPAKDHLSITYQGNQLAHSTITVLDAKGQKITDYQLNFTIENGLMLDVSNYPAGLYFLTVASGQLKAVHRFVKR